MAAPPSGTVTFLFTDIEGSTRLWEEHPEAMHEALARHDAIVRDAVEQHDGYVVKTTGDGIHAAFAARRTVSTRPWRPSMRSARRRGMPPVRSRSGWVCTPVTRWWSTATTTARPSTGPRA